jgi:parallel beta-helix repeat protein
MTQPILRVLNQEKLANGHSPHAHIPRIWGRPGTHPAMSKGLLRALTLAAFAMLGTLTCVASAGAAEAIKSCGTLGTFGRIYVLAADLTSCGDCLVVTRDRITIDLAGYTISGACDGVGAGVTDSGTALQGTTVKNGTIKGFADGVFLANSTSNQIPNLTSSGNSGDGINVGARSNVKGCVIEDNGLNGLIIGDFGHVQDCTITGHFGTEESGGSGISGGFGIVGAARLLVRDNDVVDNRVGILVGDSSNVSFNTASNNVFSGLFASNRSLVTGNTTNGNGTAGITTGGNTNVSHNTSNGNGGGIAVGVDGVFDGTRSLVTGNTTNDNDGAGVEAWCPSTVTNNNSSGNGSNYTLNGPGCQDKNNN